MKDSDFLDLANRVIDGVGTEHDRLALGAVLRDSTPRRLEFEQLSAVSSVLDAVRPVEVPDGLRDRILAQIPAPSVSRARPSLLSAAAASVRELIGSKPMVGLSYAVAAGLMVGVVLTLLLPVKGVDESSVLGTISTQTAGGEFLEVDRAAVEDAGVRAEAVLLVSGEQFRVQITVSAGEPLAAEARWDLTGPVWTGIVREAGSDTFDASVSSQGVALSGVQKGKYTLSGSLERGDQSEFELTLRRDGWAGKLITLRIPSDS